jgi:hypothetical protein
MSSTPFNQGKRLDTSKVLADLIFAEHRYLDARQQLINGWKEWIGHGLFRERRRLLVPNARLQVQRMSLNRTSEESDA